MPNACLATRETLNLVHMSENLVNCDLFRSFRSGIEFDLVVFNPPYVPSADIEAHIAGSNTWHGGESGLEVINRFFHQVLNFVNIQKSLIYLICLEQTDLRNLNGYMILIKKMKHAKVITKKCANEILTVHKFYPIQ